MCASCGAGIVMARCRYALVLRYGEWGELILSFVAALVVSISCGVAALVVSISCGVNLMQARSVKTGRAHCFCAA